MILTSFLYLNFILFLSSHFLLQSVVLAPAFLTSHLSSLLFFNPDYGLTAFLNFSVKLLFGFEKQLQIAIFAQILKTWVELL